MKYHSKIEIDTALRMLNMGKKTEPEATVKQLLKARHEGKKYWSGCDNMDDTGACKGHEESRERND